MQAVLDLSALVKYPSSGKMSERLRQDSTARALSPSTGKINAPSRLSYSSVGLFEGPGRPTRILYLQHTIEA